MDPAFALSMTAERKGRAIVMDARNEEKTSNGKATSSVGCPKWDAAFVALVARVRKKLAKPQLTKSVREQATKKQIASWTKVF